MCSDCMVPFNKEMTVKNVFERLKIEGNDGLFERYQSYSRVEDFMLNVVWNQNFKDEFFNGLVKVTAFSS